MSSLARELSELSVSAFRQESKYELPAPTREAVVREIASHRTAILRLSTHLNSFATPARLPDELLCEIFRYYAVAKTEQPHASPYAFIQITHVCRYWRNVALNFHPFWSQIQIMDDAKYTPCIEEMLIRSKKAPLMVTANIHVSTKSVSLKVFKFVAAQIHRVQSLDLTIPSVNFSGIAKLFGKKNATETLKSLRLVHYRNSRSGTKATSLEFPPCLLPRLEKLDTTDFSLDTIAPFAKTTVRSFIFKDSRTWGSQNHATSVDDLLRVIQKMPLLTTLSILASENLVSQKPKSRSQPIQLNNLESSKLYGFDVDQLTDFMSNVHFPVTTRLAVTTHNQPSSPNRYGAVQIPLHLTSLLVKRMGGDQDDFGFHSASLNSSGSPNLQAWRNDDSEITDSVEPDFRLTLPNTNSTISLLEFFQDFTPLIYVHTLEMKSFEQHDLQSPSFAGFISTLPNLKNLTISSSTQYNVVVLLSAVFTSRKSLSLDTLHLNDITFVQYPPYNDPGAKVVVDADGEYYKKGKFLAAHLARRIEMGNRLAIGKLIVRSCKLLDSNQVEGLRPFVENENLDWDGERC
ncbi:hypothetical protein C8Q75DRAFT_781881 [Abortiporus biennis]|nr:hypothetical protein C8Q75DRAFT_781881 [Abortiporus biennis]